MINNNQRLHFLHDWEITCICTDRINNSVELYITNPDSNEKVLIIFHNVKSFYMSEMLMQNVILDVLLFEQIETSDYYIHCCKVLNIEHELLRLYHDNKIIYFEPSVGAEIACCFSSFTINVKSESFAQ